MEDLLLTDYAKKYTQSSWGVEFDGVIKMSPKLLQVRQYGEYVATSNTIYIASQLFVINEQFAMMVLEHELCHWYAVQQGKEYHDGVVDFENLLRKQKAITNGNYAHTRKLPVAESQPIEPQMCSKCKAPQFDKLPQTRMLFTNSKCCHAPVVLDPKADQFHNYEYYKYVN